MLWFLRAQPPNQFRICFGETITQGDQKIMNYLQLATELLPEIIQWRRYLHQNAEISFEEYRTADFICSVLDRYGIEHSRVATTGVLAKLNGEHPDRPIVLRADIDALPILEKVDVPFACKSGVMHACGHDLHIASLLGTLVLLRKIGCRGTIWGLFQPGEELHPGGASIVLSEGIFDTVTPRAFVGQHVSPELSVGTFGMRAGTFMASTDEVHITMQGRGGHGAMPHLGSDTVVASAAMIMAMQTIVSRNNDALSPAVLSFGRVIADGATNIIPNEVYIEGTLRTMSEPFRALAKERIAAVAHGTAQAYGVHAVVSIKDGYPSVFNDEALTARAIELGRNLFGDGAVVNIPMRMTAEDFGFYAESFPSIFYRLGVGESAPLHNSLFCPDERSLAFGAAMMAMLACELCSCP